MPEMAQFVYDFYQSKLQQWNKLKNKQNEEEAKRRNKERLQKLDEEEKILREKLFETIEKSETRKQRLPVNTNNSDSSSSSESESEENELRGQSNRDGDSVEKTEENVETN